MRAIELFGREASISTLATLITTHYDFPYVRDCRPRIPPPSVLEDPIADTRPIPGHWIPILGNYRCTRLGEEQKIPGINLLMRDRLSRLDWTLDCFMERHRMKCWATILRKAYKWADTRSPYVRATNPEVLTKLLDAELTGKNNPPVLDHAALRDMLLEYSELIPPTVELYLQAIYRLNPSSITSANTIFGVSVAAMACVASSQLPCSYSKNGLCEEAAASLREFVSALDKPITERDTDADLIFVDIVPYKTHDMRGYWGSPSDLSYPDYVKQVLSPILKQRPRTGPPIRIALITPLRDFPSQPTVEPVLLNILATEGLDLVGALVASRRDYAAYLMMTSRTPRTDTEKWSGILRSAYPELFGLEAPKETIGGTGTWDSICLEAVLPGLMKSSPRDNLIALQGPRKVQGKRVFPARTRNCATITETHNTESGDIVYLFKAEPDPLPDLPVVPEEPEIADPLISRMVSGIQQSIAAAK